jgi:hypothetical protein
MSKSTKHRIEKSNSQDELVCQIIHHLDHALDDIPDHVAKKLAEIRVQVLQRRFGNREAKTN